NAFATEGTGDGNEQGTSNTVKFEVNTESPTVTIAQPETLSNHRTPAFSGTASEATQVTVHVFEGQSQVATATTTASGGKWTTTTLSAELPAGRHSFKAYATEVSSLGNADGTSNSVFFEVDTEPPTVTLLSGPPARSNNTSPSFSGTASENTEV